MPDDDELERLTRELYVRKEPEDIKQRRQSLHRLGLTEHTPAGPEADVSRAQFKNLALLRARRFMRTFRITSIIVGLLVVIVWAVLATIWYRRSQEVTQADIAVSVTAPSELTAGEEIVYHIDYGNESRVDWQNVELVFEAPHGFRFIGSSLEPALQGKQYVYRLGDLAAGVTGEFAITGQLIGEHDEAAAARAELFITPANFPSGRFSNSAAFSTTITALPLEVSLDVPTDAASGERVRATITTRNLSRKRLESVYLKIKTAPGMQLAPDDSDFSPGFSSLTSLWELPPLEPLASAERTLILYVEGQPGEQRSLEVEAGLREGEELFSQRILSPVITLSASELLVEQLYNGSSEPITVAPGDSVSGKVRYTNIGTVGLKDVIVEVRFEGAALDVSSLTHQGGAYDSRERKIVWSPATIPGLAVVQPKQSGEVSFSFKVLSADRLPKEGEQAKNNIIVSTAVLDSPDLPTPVGQPRRVVSDRAVISLRTAITLQADALYDDGRLGLTSSGPLPPVVGQTTTYTVRFRVGSVLNDVGNVRLVAVLPDGVRYTGSLYKTAGEVQVNERSGEIVWTLPLVEGLSGRARPPVELHMQVAITPGDNVRGQSVSFLNKLTIEGVDQFVEERIALSVGTFPSTATAVPGKGTVQ